MSGSKTDRCIKFVTIMLYKILVYLNVGVLSLRYRVEAKVIIFYFNTGWIL